MMKKKRTGLERKLKALLYRIRQVEDELKYGTTTRSAVVGDVDVDGVDSRGVNGGRGRIHLELPHLLEDEEEEARINVIKQTRRRKSKRNVQINVEGTVQAPTEKIESKGTVSVSKPDDNYADKNDNRSDKNVVFGEGDDGSEEFDEHDICFILEQFIQLLVDSTKLTSTSTSKIYSLTIHSSFLSTVPENLKNKCYQTIAEIILYPKQQELIEIVDQKEEEEDDGDEKKESALSSTSPKRTKRISSLRHLHFASPGLMDLDRLFGIRSMRVPKNNAKSNGRDENDNNKVMNDTDEGQTNHRRENNSTKTILNQRKTRRLSLRQQRSQQQRCDCGLERLTLQNLLSHGRGYNYLPDDDGAVDDDDEYNNNNNDVNESDKEKAHNENGVQRSNNADYGNSSSSSLSPSFGLGLLTTQERKKRLPSIDHIFETILNDLPNLSSCRLLDMDTGVKVDTMVSTILRRTSITDLEISAIPSSYFASSSVLSKPVLSKIAAASHLKQIKLMGIPLDVLGPSFPEKLHWEKRPTKEVNIFPKSILKSSDDGSIKTVFVHNSSDTDDDDDDDGDEEDDDEGDGDDDDDEGDNDNESTSSAEWAAFQRMITKTPYTLHPRKRHGLTSTTSAAMDTATTTGTVDERTNKTTSTNNTANSTTNKNNKNRVKGNGAANAVENEKISRRSNLEILNLNKCGIGKGANTAWIDFLKEGLSPSSLSSSSSSSSSLFCPLRELRLSKNFLPDDCGVSIARCLSRKKQNLNSYHYQNDEAGKNDSKKIHHNIEVIDLSYNQLWTETAYNFALVLGDEENDNSNKHKKNNSDDDDDDEENNLCNNDGRKNTKLGIGMPLTSPPPPCPLLELDLSGNLLGTKAVEAIGKSLTKNQRMKVLRLKDTGLTASGCNAFAEMLQFNVTLEELDLSHNKAIKSTGLTVLANGLEFNNTLKRLYLAGVGLINSQSVYCLCKSLEGNTSLETLNLGSVDITKTAESTDADEEGDLDGSHSSDIAQHELDDECYLQFRDLVLNGNFHLKSLSLPPPRTSDMTSMIVVQRQMDMYIRLNMLGRKQLLQKIENVHDWIDAISSCIHHLDCLYFLMRSNPTLCNK